MTSTNKNEDDIVDDRNRSSKASIKIHKLTTCQNSKLQSEPHNNGDIIQNTAKIHIPEPVQQLTIYNDLWKSFLMLLHVATSSLSAV